LQYLDTNVRLHKLKNFNCWYINISGWHICNSFNSEKMIIYINISQILMEKAVRKILQDFFNSSLSNDFSTFLSQIKIQKYFQILIIVQIYFLMKLLSYQQPQKKNYSKRSFGWLYFLIIIILVILSFSKATTLCWKCRLYTYISNARG
jgi:hypothetical protein